MSNITGITVSREQVRGIIEAWLNADVLRAPQRVAGFDVDEEIVMVTLAEGQESGGGSQKSGGESRTWTPVYMMRQAGDELAPRDAAAVEPVAAPVEPVAPQPQGRKWGSTSAVGAANRARVAELAAQGKGLKAIVAETGMKESTAYGHLRALREAAAGGNGFRGAE